MSNTSLLSSRLIRASVLQPKKQIDKCIDMQMLINRVFEVFGLIKSDLLRKKITEIRQTPVFCLDKEEYHNIVHLMDIDLLNFFSSLSMVLKNKFVVVFSESLTLTFEFDYTCNEEKLPCLIIIKDTDSRSLIFLEKIKMIEFDKIDFYDMGETKDVVLNYDDLFKETEKMIVLDRTTHSINRKISCLEETKNFSNSDECKDRLYLCFDNEENNTYEKPNTHAESIIPIYIEEDVEDFSKADVPYSSTQKKEICRTLKLTPSQFEEQEKAFLLIQQQNDEKIALTFQRKEEQEMEINRAYFTTVMDSNEIIHQTNEIHRLEQEKKKQEKKKQENAKKEQEEEDSKMAHALALGFDDF